MIPNRTTKRGVVLWVLVAGAGLGGGGLGGCGLFDRYPPMDPRVTGTMATPVIRPPTAVATDSLLRGRKLQEQGLEKLALQEFERAIESNPLLVGAHMAAGDIYMKQGDFDMAAARFGEAARIAPGSFDANLKHGQALQALGQLLEAVKAYTIALAIKPNDSTANMNAGVVYLQLNDAPGALPFAEKAVKLDPRNGQARVNLGAVYSSLGRHEDAVTEYLQASELLPSSGELLLNLADSLQKSGQLEQAANTLEQLVRTDPSAKTYERLGAVNFKLRQYEPAEAAFRKAVEIDPNHFPALNGVAVCLLNKFVLDGNDAAKLEAIPLLRRSLKIERNQPYIANLVEKYRVAK